MQITDHWVVEWVRTSPSDRGLYSTWNTTLSRQMGQVFVNQTEAEGRANERNRFGGIDTTYVARRARPDEWRLVMASRYEREEWELPPWGKYEWFALDFVAGCFPHVSKSDPSKIAFVEDDAKGQVDRVTVMKPGRFLTRFFGDMLSSVEISEIANKFISRSQPGTLKFARTQDEIETVYTEGPSSCMSGVANTYGGVHPSRVYASPDLAVAYIQRGEDITARSVVWPEKKIYVEIYGDHHRLFTALEAEGYQEGSLQGARLLRIENEDGDIVCPYLDSVGYVRVEKEYLIVDSSGNKSAADTCGYLDAGQWCDCCESRRDDNGGYVYVRRHSEEYWCESCYDDTVYSSREERTISESAATRLADGTWVSDWYFADNDGFTCDGNEENYLGESLVILETGESWSSTHFDDHGFICAITGLAYATTDGVEHPEHGWIHKDTDEATAEPQLELELEAA